MHGCTHDSTAHSDKYRDGDDGGEGADDLAPVGVIVDQRKLAEHVQQGEVHGGGDGAHEVGGDPARGVDHGPGRAVLGGGVVGAAPDHGVVPLLREVCPGPNPFRNGL